MIKRFHHIPGYWKRRLGTSPAAPAAELNETRLKQRAGRNMRAIALLGLALIAADLALSLIGQDVKIVREDGMVYLIRPAAGDDAGHITLDAAVRSGEETYENRFDIRLEPQKKETGTAAGSGADTEGLEGTGPRAGRTSSAEDLIRGELRSIAAGFNEDPALRRVPLPMRLESGEAIRWRRTRSANTLPLAALTAFLMLLVYRGRLRPLQKLERSRRDSVRRQLPAFLNELVLLLNAGLVLSRAFETAVAGMTRERDDDYFRENMRRISHSVKHTNAAMQEELRAFARSSGVSELMRVSGIISDNINKGADLNKKLERESARLWLARKLDAEERGRLAETKMTLPLAIFLCVLILITVSPALLQL